MADTSYKIDAPSARRLDRVCRAVLGQGARTGGAPAAADDQVETIFARITHVSSDDDPRTYSWEEVYLNADGTFDAVEDSRTGAYDGDLAAYDAGGAPTSSGQVVLLRRAPVKQDDDSYELGWIIVSARTAFIPVTVSKTSGAAGDASTTCSFVYTVYDFDGHTLATGAYPAWARLPGKMIAATHGTATVSVSGVVALWQVDEVPDHGSCS